MSRFRRGVGLVLSVTGISLVMMSSGLRGVSVQSPASSGAVDFQRDVRPISPW